MKSKSRRSRFFALIGIIASFIFLNIFYTNCSKGFSSISSENLNSSYSLPSLSDPNQPSSDELAPLIPTDFNSFVPKVILPPPVSSLPAFVKKPYTTSALNENFAIVYIRIPRVTQSSDYTNYLGIKKIGLKNWDLMQTLPETSHRVGDMSGPGQLVYRNRQGQERVLFDCMVSADCLPMDPTVSFDGKKVIFSVLKGKFQFAMNHGLPLPYNYIESTEAKLVIVDIQSGELNYLPHISGTYDTGPIFLPNGKIMFTSNRANDLGSSHSYLSPNKERSLQLWLANGDGTQAERVGPHELDGALHPYVMSDGRVLFSTWQIRHLQAHSSNNGSIGSPSAKDNKFWLASVDHTGGKWMAVLGAHGHEYELKGSPKDFKALHFVTETSLGWLCSTDYYRGNNFGSGNILCWQKEQLGIEGKGPKEENHISRIFVPRNLFSLATWSTSTDDFSTFENGRYLGKLRDPMALPGNQLLLTLMKGPCSKIQDKYSVEVIQNEPIGCDGGIYRTTKVPSTAPEDLVKVVDDPNWHEFMARVAEPYEFVYEKEKPAIPSIQRDPYNRCILASSSLESEVDTVENYNFFNPRDCAMQGCKVRSIPMSSVKAIRFWKILPNKNKSLLDKKIRSVSGNEQILLGDVPINEDGSFIAELPCETPYVMAGVDQDGNTVLRDQVPQSLRLGEVRTCTGCHLHSKPGRPFEESIASTQMNSPFQLTTGKVPIMKKGWWVPDSKINSKPEYVKDIFPILNNKCVSCHSGETAAKGLRFDIPGTSLLNNNNPAATSSWYRIVWDSAQYFSNEKKSYFVGNPTNYNLEKPHTSLYVNSAFAVESLFLWKAVNKRLDGRTDTTHTTDIDFGPNHPTSITEDEARLLRDWLDSGAYSDFVN